MSAQEAGGLQKIGISPASLAANKNPVQWASWVENVLIPAMDKHGYITGSAQAGFLKQWAEDKNISALMPLLNQLTAIETNAQAYQAVTKDPTDTYSSIANNNVLLNSRALAAATDSLAGTLAKLASPDGTAMLRGLTDFMNTFDKLAVANPKIAKVVLELGAVGGAFAFLYKPLKAIIGLINKLRGNKGQDDASIPCCCCEDGRSGAGVAKAAKAAAEVGMGLFSLRQLTKALGFNHYPDSKPQFPQLEAPQKTISFRKLPAIQFKEHAPEEIAGKSPAEVSEVAKSAVDKAVSTGGDVTAAAAALAAIAFFAHKNADAAAIASKQHGGTEKNGKSWDNSHLKLEHYGRFGRYYYGEDEDDNGEKAVKPTVKLKPKVNIGASEADGLPNILEGLTEKMQLP